MQLDDLQFQHSHVTVYEQARMNEACWGGVGMEGEDMLRVECWVNSTLGVSESDK